MRTRSFLSTPFPARCPVAALVLSLASITVAGREDGVGSSKPPPPPVLSIVSVDRIWDQAPHNAFTDLVRWRDAFYCAFREGRGHVSTDGKVRVLVSRDTRTWRSAGLLELQGYDLRDAHLAVTPQGKLMVLGGAAPREEDNRAAPTGTFVSFTTDGEVWSEPRVAVSPGRWLWRITWHEGTGYGFAYHNHGARGVDLLTTRDGLTYETLVPRLLTEESGSPNEAVLRFGDDQTCYAIVRRDGRENSAMLGTSRPPYKKWAWSDLGSYLGGPNLLAVPGGHWIAAGRLRSRLAMFQRSGQLEARNPRVAQVFGAPQRARRALRDSTGPSGSAKPDLRKDTTCTALLLVDVKAGSMTELLRLPSGGDTSYPGLVWHDGLLYVSYYSSHDAKTSIYLAKVRVE